MLKTILEGLKVVFIGSLDEKTNKENIKSVELSKIEKFDVDSFFEDLLDLTGIDLTPNDDDDNQKMIDAVTNGDSFVTWDVYGEGVCGTSSDKNKLKKTLKKEFGSNPSR